MRSSELHEPKWHRYGLIASAQNALDVFTTCAFAKSAPMSVSANPLFGCPEYGVKPSAIAPPGFMTRRISRNPATASGQTCIELIASAFQPKSGSWRLHVRAESAEQ